MAGGVCEPQQILRYTVNERAVRILLECILVAGQFPFFSNQQRFLFQEKYEFVINKLREVGDKNADGSKRQLTAEELSEFYKSFLNENYETHRNYNR